MQLNTLLLTISVGIFTIAGIIDSFVFHGQRAMKKKKMEMGKFGWFFSVLILCSSKTYLAFSAIYVVLKSVSLFGFNFFNLWGLLCIVLVYGYDSTRLAVEESFFHKSRVFVDDYIYRTN